MGIQPRAGDSPPAVQREHRRRPRLAYRLTETFGLVLLLILVDYVAASTLLSSDWGRVGTVFLLGATLWYILQVCRSRRIWQVLAVVYLVAGTMTALLAAVVPGSDLITQGVYTLGGVLLLVTPFVILRGIASHRVITTETVLGAICVYLLIGFSFAFIYSALAQVSSTAFFEGRAPSNINDTLFFSYSTLTTVGYGNLVPAGSLGQSVAMLEALSGQIYLVLIVARLVSLWGQERPRPDRSRRSRRGDDPWPAERRRQRGDGPLDPPGDPTT